MKRQTLIVMVLLAIASVALSACSVNVERNPDGSLKVESSMTEASLQNELKLAIADPLVRDLTADLRDGYVLVSGERERAGGSGSDTLSFRLDLGVSDGHLTARISNAQLNDIPIEQERVNAWNERIASHLEQVGQNRSNSTLQAVTISGETVTMVWRVETKRSRGE
jgi:hypothetical protein